MIEVCNQVIFTPDAFNTIVAETADKHPVETGGILLGNIEEGNWYVIESIEPGPDSVFQTHFFEYDHAFVNYLARARAKRYEKPLKLLGLWHRHPGSFDRFSSTDDETNRDFALTTEIGAISGLVNIDPEFRFTIYHFGENLHYEKRPYTVSSEQIPSNFLKKKFEDQIKNNKIDAGDIVKTREHKSIDKSWELPDELLDIMLKENEILEEQKVFDINFEMGEPGTIYYQCELKDNITHISPPKTFYWKLIRNEKGCFVRYGKDSEQAYKEGVFLELLKEKSGLSMKELKNEKNNGKQ